MNLEEYLEELFEELYQEAKERFKNDIRYVYASTDIEAIHFEWKEHYSQQEEKYLETKAELEARLVTYMGGRAAEEIMCDSVTTGASNDIEMATRIARAMVTQFGMSEEFGLMGVESVENRYLDGRAVTNCGDDTIAKVDEVVKVMLQKAYDTAKEMLLTHRDVLERIAGYLYEHETITGKEFMDIFNEMAEAKQPIDVDAEDVTVQTEVQTAELSENETELSGNEPVAPEEAFEE